MISAQEAWSIANATRESPMVAARLHLEAIEGLITRAALRGETDIQDPLGEDSGVPEANWRQMIGIVAGLRAKGFVVTAREFHGMATLIEKISWEAPTS